MGQFNDFHGLKVELAAQDSDLVAFYELRMKGDSDCVGDGRLYDLARYDVGQLHHEVQRDYNIPPGKMRQVIGRCVANIAGMNVGVANG